MVERYYTQFANAAYILPADGEEQKRLAAQHKNLTSAFDNRLILAPVHLVDGDEVLEIGAAAGSWLFDVYTKFGPPSKVNFHAIDIESRLFPTDLPHNITFSIDSVLNLPRGWTKRFSYVHQRLLMAALTAPQWPIALREIYRVLKPGGWVELAENDAKAQVPEGHKTHPALVIAREAFVGTGFKENIGTELPGLLKEAGFVDIVHVPREIPLGKWGGELGEGCIASVGGALRGIKKAVLLKGTVKTEKEYDDLMDDLYREWNEVPGHWIGHYITYARKPIGTSRLAKCTL